MNFLSYQFLAIVFLAIFSLPPFSYKVIPITLLTLLSRIPPMTSKLKHQVAFQTSSLSFHIGSILLFVNYVNSAMSTALCLKLI